MTQHARPVKASSPRLFRFCPRVIHGTGALAQLPELLDSDEKYLLITDEGISRAGLTRRVGELEPRHGIPRIAWQTSKKRSPSPATLLALRSLGLEVEVRWMLQKPLPHASRGRLRWSSMAGELKCQLLPHP